MPADSAFASTITATSDATDPSDVMSADELAIVASDGGGLKMPASGNSLRGGTMVDPICIDTDAYPQKPCTAPKACVQHFYYKDVGGRCVSPCVDGKQPCQSSWSGIPFCACTNFPNNQCTGVGCV